LIPEFSIIRWEGLMKLPRRQFLYLAAGAAVLPAMSRIASAQSYPTRPITLIVPFPPGGGTDVVARIMAERMRPLLGEPMVIENVGGAGGSMMPEIPTSDEAGAPGLYTSGWFGLFAPKGTPLKIIARLNGAMVEALADPAVRARFAELGIDAAPREQQTPAGLAAFHKAEVEKWWPIIKAAGIKAE
jgi:tripartite-type tricarboxylate transporter receptor subunit TctC